MPKQIIIAEKNHIAAVFAEDQIQELVVATGNQQVGDIYLGTVENVISGIDAAFVNIGDAEKNGFIHVTDLGPLRLKRSAGAITELLTPHQSVLVQVMKEPTGTKGPRLTGNISLPGRYLVLMPYGKGVSLSRRIKNDNERNRLRALAILLKPAGMGLLVRTEADGKGEDAIIEDLEFLKKQWEKIQQEANTLNPPALLNRDDDFIQRVLRDMYSDDVNRIVVDSDDAVRRVKKQLNNWGSGKNPHGLLIDSHQDSRSILDYFRVNSAIKEALKPRVDLPSGGYIIIEPTEALTVIDVNSGSFTHSATSRETVLWTNTEAAIEIARQLKLRNIGGVIVVDFIDMDSRRDKLKLLEHFNRVLQSDKARPQIAQLSELGLVELTRKRQGKNIYELFSQPCSHCGGLGLVGHFPGHYDLESLTSNNYYQPPQISKTEKPILDEKIISLDDFSSDNDELDLVNHPSYQESNNGNSRRRRRRRENGVKEEPILVGSNGNGGEIESKPERKERSLLSRSLRRDESQWEKVVVEMTSAEQDVYAFMGVSPLLRLEQEFKDPKSVLVYVRNPEEQKNIDTAMEKNQQEDVEIADDEGENALEVASPSTTAEVIFPQGKETMVNELEIDVQVGEVDDQIELEEDDNFEESSKEVFDGDNSETAEETITDAIIKEALESDRPVVRTRRRRTSRNS
ncbi:Rne/Rng family ribonuclease [Cyanobacterium aponinum FACHB-4101]|uniref:Rne/Rng family ribonuclease n=1 Tax=Cyanobacterium aponinum TaxID=379064 RepID=UPI0016801C35|nr:Rne/Rng family ribonuclease [Cyanobacterium aponinum]MBD2394132.1 Rne/Rng family ribonuclease [Cyanobacterium aponinum FACHB-4101]